MKILVLILLVLLFKCKYHLQVDDITQYSCEFFLRPHYLLYTYLSLIPNSFLFSIKFIKGTLTQI